LCPGYETVREILKNGYKILHQTEGGIELDYAFQKILKEENLSDSDLVQSLLGIQDYAMDERLRMFGIHKLLEDANLTYVYMSEHEQDLEENTLSDRDMYCLYVSKVRLRVNGFLYAQDSGRHVAQQIIKGFQAGGILDMWQRYERYIINTCSGAYRDRDNQSYISNQPKPFTMKSWRVTPTFVFGVALLLAASAEFCIELVLTRYYKVMPSIKYAEAYRYNWASYFNDRTFRIRYRGKWRLKL